MYDWEAQEAQEAREALEVERAEEARIVNNFRSCIIFLVVARVIYLAFA